MTEWESTMFERLVYAVENLVQSSQDGVELHKRLLEYWEKDAQIKEMRKTQAVEQHEANMRIAALDAQGIELDNEFRRIRNNKEPR
jgi:uncharacterized membrane protein